jgi:hypothetical protein
VEGKIFGQFGQNLSKSGQSLEKVSQPRGLHVNSNKFDFLKQEFFFFLFIKASYKEWSVGPLKQSKSQKSSFTVVLFLNYSCETALHELISYLNENMNNRLISLLLFVDYRKAFDL